MKLLAFTILCVGFTMVAALAHKENTPNKAQASEVLAHLAFYAGWPNVFSAVPVVKGVFDSRPN
jgi:alkylhydroperoxidase/carboxymuconolactone decarboxylase family protein YurZ